MKTKYISAICIGLTVAMGLVVYIQSDNVSRADPVPADVSTTNHENAVAKENSTGSTKKSADEYKIMKEENGSLAAVRTLDISEQKLEELYLNDAQFDLYFGDFVEMAGLDLAEAEEFKALANKKHAYQLLYMRGNYGAMMAAKYDEAVANGDMEPNMSFDKAVDNGVLSRSSQQNMNVMDKQIEGLLSKSQYETFQDYEKKEIERAHVQTISQALGGHLSLSLDQKRNLVDHLYLERKKFPAIAEISALMIHEPHKVTQDMVATYTHATEQSHMSLEQQYSQILTSDQLMKLGKL